MNHLNPNKTDDFFRQALSSAPDLSPSEKDWQGMERLLKAKPARRPVIGWLYWPAGIAAALLIFFSLWFSRDTGTVPDQIAKSKPSTEQPELDKVISGKDQQNKAPLSQGEGEKSKMLQAGSITKADSPVPEHHPVVNMDILQQKKQLAFNPVTPEPSLPVNPAEVPERNPADEITLNKEPQVTAGLLKLNDKPVSDSLISKKKAAVQDPNGKWALSLAFSSDMNSVKGISSSSLGMSLGMGMSYKITRSISASTGLYYSQKKYTSDKTSYKVTEKPFATWTSYSKQIDADCRVIDIPVNLNIVMMSNRNVNILASAGISSYIMLSETYNFIYNPSPAYPTGGREYTLRNANQHILSIVNLSVGLEKPLTKQSSLVIQPYAKIPLTGIGQGETDLKSFGVGFQLNYSLKKKNKFFRSEP